MIEQIESLVKNYMTVARERLAAVFIFSLALAHFDLIPVFMISATGALLIVYMAQMYFVNLVFQAHAANGKPEFEDWLARLNIVSIAFSALLVATFIFMALI